MIHGLALAYDVQMRMRARAGGAALALLVAAGGSAPSFAGFTVQVEYVDAEGAAVSVTATDAEYVHHRRTLYRRPRGAEGSPFRDDEVRATAFPFAGRRVRFQEIRRVGFERRAGEGGERLILSFELTTGEIFEMPGAELEGASHPISPALRFRAGPDVVTIPLDPLTAASRRAGRPSLVGVEFPNNPDRRRPAR